MVDDKAIYVNEYRLKFFESDVHFEGMNSRSPLYVYENDELVGLILPVNYKEGD